MAKITKGDLSTVAKDIIAAVNAENVQMNENAKAVKENKKAVEQSASTKKEKCRSNQNQLMKMINILSVLQ